MEAQKFKIFFFQFQTGCVFAGDLVKKTLQRKQYERSPSSYIVEAEILDKYRPVAVVGQISLHLHDISTQLTFR